MIFAITRSTKKWSANKMKMIPKRKKMNVKKEVNDGLAMPLNRP